MRSETPLWSGWHFVDFFTPTFILKPRTVNNFGVTEKASVVSVYIEKWVGLESEMTFLYFYFQVWSI